MVPCRPTIELLRVGKWRATACRARRSALVIDVDKPTLSYSVHDTLRALFAVYEHTGEQPWHESLFDYTETPAVPHASATDLIGRPYGV